MKKKILSIFLTIFLICQMFVIPGVSANQSPISEKETDLLVSLGLLKGDVNGDLRLGDSLLRSEYTALILRLMGFNEIEESNTGKSSFEDVPESHWAKEYIEFARSINLINGISETNFEPDRKVTRQEAIKILVAALGYGELAEHNGGYPYGYENLAAKLKLLKNEIAGDTFTRGAACRLLVNSLKVDIMDYTGKVVSGNTVLKSYLGIDMYSGYITGTPEVYAERKVFDGNIEIDGVNYKNLYKSDEELFGCKVEFYVKTANNDDTVYYIETLPDETRLEIDSENIISQTSLDNFHYTNEYDRAKSVNLSDNLIIFYNGKRVGTADVDKNLIIPKQGKVILCTSGNSTQYEVAIVQDYRTVNVEYATEDAIYDAFKNHVYLENADEYTITRGGKEIDATELKKGDVISVAESLDKKRINIIADYSEVTGSIYAIDKSRGGENIYVVNSDGNYIEAEASDSYLTAISNSLAENFLEIDNRLLSIKLDAFGKIAYIKLGDVAEGGLDGLQYGYLIDIRQTKDLDSQVRMKILTASNRFETISMPYGKRVVFGRPGGAGYIENSVPVKDLVTALTRNDVVRKQLIKYRTNDSGIKEFYIVDSTQNSQYFSEDISNTFMAYRQGVLDQKYYMDSSTVVFSIPDNAIYEDVMSAGSYTKFFSEGWGKYCSLYDVENGRVGAVVLHDNVAITYDSPDRGYEMILSYGSSPIFFINKISKTFDDDGDSFVTMEGIQNGREMKVNISDEIAENLSNMQKLNYGSVIHYEMNANASSWAMTADEPQQMVVFEQIFDFEKENGSGIRWNHDIIINDNPDILTLWGTLDKIGAAYLSVTVEENNITDSYAMQIMNNAVFLKYDFDNRRFEPITQYALAEGQNVYIAKQSSSQVIVVY